MTAQSFSIIERALHDLGVLLPVILVNTMGVAMPFTGWITHSYMVHIINAYGHSNCEFIPEKLKPYVNKVFGSPTTHSLHHVLSDGNFCFFLRFLDQIFGTHVPESTLAKLAYSEELSRNHQSNK